MTSTSTELDLDMSNLSCQEEDPITRNLELFKLLLLHKFPGCAVIDKDVDPVTTKKYYYFNNFKYIVNILNNSRFEAYTEEAERHIKELEYPDKTIKFCLRPCSANKNTITYWFGLLCD
jgi:hypothetical protein